MTPGVVVTRGLLESSVTALWLELRPGEPDTAEQAAAIAERLWAILTEDQSEGVAGASHIAEPPTINAPRIPRDRESWLTRWWHSLIGADGRR